MRCRSVTCNRRCRLLTCDSSVPMSSSLVQFLSSKSLGSVPQSRSLVQFLCSIPQLQESQSSYSVQLQESTSTSLGSIPAHKVQHDAPNIHHRQVAPPPISPPVRRHAPPVPGVFSTALQHAHHQHPGHNVHAPVQVVHHRQVVPLLSALLFAVMPPCSRGFLHGPTACAAPTSRSQCSCSCSGC